MIESLLDDTENNGLEHKFLKNKKYNLENRRY